jgi:hypothetical protein
MDGGQKLSTNHAELFKENNYVYVKQFMSKEMTHFLYKYTLLKSKAIETMILSGTLPYNSFLGGFCEQVQGAFGAYADFAMETVLQEYLGKMEKITGLRLCPTYSYQRTYKKGHELERHKDRPSCEISATLCLGYDNTDAPDDYKWGMFIEKSGEVGLEGKEIKLEAGDLIAYRGCDLEHWREKYLGTQLVQVFLHYNDADGVFGEQNIYDTRPSLGLTTQHIKQTEMPN